MCAMFPRFHSTPFEAIRELIQERVIIGQHQFVIRRPMDPDSLMDHPWVRSAYAADGYNPYWARLWPSARMLAKVLLSDEHPPTEVLDVGCGLGLAGIAALARGHRVTFADIDHTALRFAAQNAYRNGFSHFRTLPLDLRAPPVGLRFPFIIASDLLYEERLVEPLVDFLDATLTSSGFALITDPDRQPSRLFRWKLAEAGFDVQPSLVRSGEPRGERVKGTLYRIRRNDDSISNNQRQDS